MKGFLLYSKYRQLQMHFLFPCKGVLLGFNYLTYGVKIIWLHLLNIPNLLFEHYSSWKTFKSLNLLKLGVEVQ